MRTDWPFSTEVTAHELYNEGVCYYPDLPAPGMVQVWGDPATGKAYYWEMASNVVVRFPCHMDFIGVVAGHAAAADLCELYRKRDIPF